MPERKPLAEPAELIYLYDGSLAGFYCCVYESVYLRQFPYAIEPWDRAQPSLLPQKRIISEPAKANKVRDSLPAKISPRAAELVETVFLSCMARKELALLDFLLLAYRQGPQTPHMLAHPKVAPLLAAEKHLRGEAHLLLGFIRFSDYDGALAATVTPKNFILPFIANHFIGRYSNENFLIFDKTHRAALVYQDRKRQFIQLEQLELPPVGEDEQKYRQLWKRFYQTIAIEARENPRCRMTHMPKRYWENMTEMQDLLSPPQLPKSRILLNGGENN